MDREQNQNTYIKINQTMLGNQMIWIICFQHSMASDQFACPFQGNIAFTKLRGAKLMVSSSRRVLVVIGTSVPSSSIPSPSGLN